MGGDNTTSSSLKYWALGIRVVLSSGLILTLRYSRTQQGDMYISSSAVVIIELLKLTACLALTLIEEGSIWAWLRCLHNHILSEPLPTLKVAVPAFIYVLQNNLQFVAISNLDAATFQVTYQLKVLTAALFSVLMLKRALSRMQCASLFLLFVGIALVQLQPSLVGTNKPNFSEQKPLVGFVAALVSSLCSGFAGVYFEMILKGSKSASIWIRNIQLGVFGALLSILTMLVKDGDKIRTKGVLFGYSSLVWLVLCMQAFSGLLVAVVVKYSDNILKSFATSVAIVVSCVVSVLFFDFVLSFQFVLGTIIVLFAIYLYGRN